MKNVLVILLMAVTLTSCTTEPEPINFGKDICEHCKMVISDEKFGGELITEKGKIYKFDSAECLVDYKKENSSKLDGEKTQFLVINFAKPGDFIPAKESFYLNDKYYQSPMGANIVPFETRMLAENNTMSPDAKVLTWEELLASRK